MNKSFKTARLASDMTIAEAAKVCGVTSVTFATNRENEPGMFRLDELRSMAEAFDETPRKLLIEAVNAYLCP